MPLRRFLMVNTRKFHIVKFKILNSIQFFCQLKIFLHLCTYSQITTISCICNRTYDWKWVLRDHFLPKSETLRTMSGTDLMFWAMVQRVRCLRHIIRVLGNLLLSRCSTRQEFLETCISNRFLLVINELCTNHTSWKVFSRKINLFSWNFQCELSACYTTYFINFSKGFFLGNADMLAQ